MAKTALVLGGGGIKGLAHAGAWRALVEAGVEITDLVGTSIGGLIGACIGGGDGYPDLERKALALRRRDIALVNRWAVLLNGIRQQSVFRGDAFREYAESLLPQGRFSDLHLPVTMNAVDLSSGELVWLGSRGDADIPVLDAVCASCALPVFYPPVSVGGRWLVDGGVLDPLAIEFAAGLGVDRIIAVDVSAGLPGDGDRVVELGMVAIHQRTMEITGYPRKRRRLETFDGPPLLYVRPRIDAYSTFEFGRTAFFLEEGYRAMREALSSASLFEAK